LPARRAAWFRWIWSFHLVERALGDVTHIATGDLPDEMILPPPSCAVRNAFFPMRARLLRNPFEAETDAVGIC